VNHLSSAAVPATTPATDEQRHARLLLNHVVEPADTGIGRILQRCGPVEVLAAVEAADLPDLEPDPARRARLAERCGGLRLRLGRESIEAGLAAADGVGARFLVPGDPDWPTAVDDLDDQQPIGLWIIGAAPWAEPAADLLAPDVGPGLSISMVGARACTGYGAHVAGSLAAELARTGVPIVSGAAFGIDAAAHRGALAVNGVTVAVLACGIDQVYPRTHDLLLAAIKERGAVVSELSPRSTPTRFRFLHRNRLIAALGAGTVVVEAAKRSGSLVTARLANDLGRPVMALPGPVTSDLSAGAHALVRDGATLITDAQDILETCFGSAAAPPGDRLGPSARVPLRRRKTSRAAPDRADDLDPITEQVLEALPVARAAAGADVLALARATGFAPDQVFAALGRLAALGYAASAGAGWQLAAALGQPRQDPA
jgi:DNA processing protein